MFKFNVGDIVTCVGRTQGLFPNTEYRIVDRAVTPTHFGNVVTYWVQLASGDRDATNLRIVNGHIILNKVEA